MPMLLPHPLRGRSAPLHSRRGPGRGWRWLRTVPLLASALLGACAGPGPAFKEVFPGVRVDAQGRRVEFDGEVPIDAAGSRVFLEVVACGRGSREHEALVVTGAKPSHVHAALLLAGLAPGLPGQWRWSGATLESTPPTGDGVRLTLRWVDATGRAHVEEPSAWIRDVDSGRALWESPVEPWVFAGSLFRHVGRREVYVADVEGTIVGLATFGDEVVAWTRLFSPEASVQAPQWIADPGRTPPAGTRVTVRLEPPAR
ncbi:MAG: hypothetical protein FJ255_10975 [Phycisphaerae bacterium]|nr:hypothetical protein [Phycisphaerae bacterium]